MPDVYPALKAKEFRLRRGQIVLIAAAPGVGKTALSLALALEMKRPALYISADTDSTTMLLRAASMLTGHTQRDVEKAYATDNGDWYDEVIDSVEHIRYHFDTGPSPRDIDEEMRAFAHAYGEWPELLVIDSIYNVYSGEEAGGFQGDEKTLEYLHELARLSNTAIIVLHHVTGEYEDGVRVPPRSALKGKISKIPEVVLTLWKPQESVLGCAIVKNRSGKHDPLGGHAAYLNFIPERMHIQ